MRAIAVVLASALVGFSCAGGAKSVKRKLAQIAVWEDQGWTANGRLLGYLSDRSEEVRERAALALGRVNDTLALDSLRRVLLGDPSPRVRGMAAFAMGAWQWRTGKDVLLEAVKKESDPSVLVSILEALARTYARDEYPTYIQLLHHPDPAVRAQTAQTLDAVNRRDASDSIVPLLDDPDSTVRRAAVLALIRSQSDKAAEWGMSHLNQPDPMYRAQLYRLAGAKRIDATPDVLARAQDDPEPLVRMAGADAMLSARDTNTVRRVLPRLSSEPVPGVVQRLARAIGEHWYQPASEPLRRLLKHPDPGVRAQATLELCNRQGFQCMDLIAPAARDPHPRVRMAYLDALDKVLRYAQESQVDTALALPVLRVLFSDPDPRVRAHAVQAYLSMGGADGGLYLNRLLHDRDPEAAAQAIGWIGTLHIGGYADTLYEMYKQHRDDPNPDVKWALMAAGANLLPSIQIDSMRQDMINWGLADPNRLVRWYTIAVAYKFHQDRRDGLGVYRTDLTVENVDSLLPAPTDAPVVRLQTTKGPIVIRLDPKWAPRTVRQFMTMARAGLYNAAAIQDVDPGYLAQMADPAGDGSGFPPAAVRDEYSPLRMEAGSVFWASSTRDAGRGAVAIALQRLPYQDWRCAVFGHVTEGLAIAQSLTLTDTVRTVELVPSEGL